MRLDEHAVTQNTAIVNTRTTALVRIPGIIIISLVNFWKKYKKLGFISERIGVVNRLSVSGKTQHIEKPLNADNIHLDSQARFSCQD
jgi:hypothetical protein